MCSFLSLSLCVTPRMALRQRISNTSSLRISSDLRLHVWDVYMAIDTIRALYRRIFRALDFFSISLSHCAKCRRRELFTHYDIFYESI